MNDTLHFDRKLTHTEHVFWNEFFTNFPCDSNRYLQSWTSKYKDLNILMQHYDEIKASNSYDCLNGNVNVKEFIKANMYYELLCPEAKKENHFLMCLYGLVCQEFPIEVNKEGVYIPNSLSTSNINWDKSTIAVTLAMCADLMAGRINHIYPKLKNIGSVTFNGKLNLPLKYGNDIILKIEDLKVKRYVSKNSSYEMDFQYSFASDADALTFLSPFGEQQENFLKVLHHQKLNENIEVKNTISRLKSKI